MLLGRGKSMWCLNVMYSNGVLWWSVPQGRRCLTKFEMRRTMFLNGELELMILTKKRYERRRRKWWPFCQFRNTVWSWINQDQRCFLLPLPTNLKCFCCKETSRWCNVWVACTVIHHSPDIWDVSSLSFWLSSWISNVFAILCFDNKVSAADEGQGFGAGILSLCWSP